MAKTKLKKVSVNAFEAAVTNSYEPLKVIEWNGIEIVIKKTISLKEMLEFVDGVTKSCFNEDTNAYRPEAKDFAIKIYVLEKYANFTLPKNIEMKYDLIYQSDIVSCVISHINVEQYNEIVSAINNKVDNLAQANVEAINSQMNELYNSFNNLQEKIGEIFSGVNPEDVKEIMGYLSDGRAFDSDKIVEVYNQVAGYKNGADN